MNAIKTFSTVVMSLLVISQTASAEDWLRFRGPQGAGVSVDGSVTPTEFDDQKNVLWKIDLPGAGASAPIIVGDKVILTAYSGYGQSRDDAGDMDNLKRHVICYSKSDGKKVWQKDFDPVLPEDPFQGMGVPEHGYSSSTPVSDGKHVFVFFGKSGVCAFDLDGNQLWSKSVGTSSGSKRWGSGASPVLCGDVLIINATDESNSIVGLDKNTGAELWRNDGVENVWGTPLVVGTGDDAAVVVSVPYEVWAMNPQTGKLKWFTTNGVQDSSVSASPMLDGDVVISMGGRSNTAVAVRLGGKDDVTETNTLWQGKSIARIMTPIVYDGHIYAVSKGIASCLDAKTGKQIYKERLPSIGTAVRRRSPSGNYVSPVIADGKLYQFTKNGGCYVIDAKPEFKLLASNQMAADGSEFNATPAISDGKLFVRSNRHLYCIGN
jgi:outer membrane protein assembly factor BamB